MGTQSVSKSKRGQFGTNANLLRRRMKNEHRSSVGLATTRHKIAEAQSSKRQSITKLGNQKVVQEGVDPRTMAPLPFDVLLAICLLLDVQDVISFSQVSDLLCLSLHSKKLNYSGSTSGIKNIF